MSYKVYISENKKYIVCRVESEVTVQLAGEFSAEMHQLGEEVNIHRFLTDVRQAINVSDAFKNYDYAYNEMNEIGLQRNARSATLVAPNDHSHDFVETVMQNAGYNMRIFRDEAEAISWLMEE